MKHEPYPDHNDTHMKEHIICNADDHSKFRFFQYCLIKLIFVKNLKMCVKKNAVALPFKMLLINIFKCFFKQNVYYINLQQNLVKYAFFFFKSCYALFFSFV